MNEEPLTPLLDHMADGYDHWQRQRRRHSRRRHLAVAALSLLVAVAINLFAFSLPMRYSSYAGSYGPDAVRNVDQMMSNL